MARAIIVHTLAHARAAFEAATELNLPLILQSAPDAAGYAGSLYLMELYKKAQSACPQVKSQFILDCGEDSAQAIAAMQMGYRHLISSAPPATHDKLLDIAGQHGVEIVESQPALDLLFIRDAKAACKEWLLAQAKG